MIIAVTGNKQSGKDTLAKYIIDNYNFEKYAFAQPIKEVCKIIFDWDDRHTEGELKEGIDKRWGISPRQAMQYIGTEFAQKNLGKAFPLFLNITGKKLWVHKFKYWYLKNMNKNIVITDLRFPHEMEILKELNAITIRVFRPDLTISDNHESEKYIDELNVDYELVNDSTVKDLYNTFKRLNDNYNLIKE